MPDDTRNAVPEEPDVAQPGTDAGTPPLPEPRNLAAELVDRGDGWHVSPELLTEMDVPMPRDPRPPTVERQCGTPTPHRGHRWIPLPGNVEAVCDGIRPDPVPLVELTAERISELVGEAEAGFELDRLAPRGPRPLSVMHPDIPADAWRQVSAYRWEAPSRVAGFARVAVDAFGETMSVSCRDNLLAKKRAWGSLIDRAAASMARRVACSEGTPVLGEVSGRVACPWCGKTTAEHGEPA
jgi:hypothetical protein